MSMPESVTAYMASRPNYVPQTNSYFVFEKSILSEVIAKRLYHWNAMKSLRAKHVGGLKRAKFHWNMEPASVFIYEQYL